MTAPAPTEVAGEAGIKPIDHPHRPPTAMVERDYLRKQIEQFGPEVVAATLRTYALAAPSEGSYSGSLWAIYEWLTAALASPSRSEGVSKGEVQSATVVTARRTVGAVND